MKSNDKTAEYWKARANKRMYNYMEQAEATAEKIGKAYQQAAQELEEEMKHIFSSFSAGMSEAEARRLLKKADKIDYNSLKAMYSQMKPGPERDVIMKQMDSPAYKARIRRLQELKQNLERSAKKFIKRKQSKQRAIYGDLQRKHTTVQHLTFSRVPD